MTLLCNVKNVTVMKCHITVTFHYCVKEVLSLINKFAHFIVTVHYFVSRPIVCVCVCVCVCAHMSVCT